MMMERSHKRKQTEVSEDSVESSSSAKRRRRMATSAPVRRTTTNSTTDYMTALETATSVMKLLQANFNEIAADIVDIGLEQEERWIFQIFTSSQGSDYSAECCSAHGARSEQGHRKGLRLARFMTNPVSAHASSMSVALAKPLTLESAAPRPINFWPSGEEGRITRLSIKYEIP